MAERNNAICSICGKGYHKCLSCKSQMDSAPWKMYTDTSEHYKIFQVIHGFNTGVYTKDEARSRLQSIDLSDLNELRDNIKKAIKDIIKEDKKVQNVEASVKDESAAVQDNAQPSFVNRRKKHSDIVKSDEA